MIMYTAGMPQMPFVHCNENEREAETGIEGRERKK